MHMKVHARGAIRRRELLLGAGCGTLLGAGGLPGAALAQEARLRPRVTRPAKEPERVLFIGNSYFYYGDSIHYHVEQMFRAAYPKRPNLFRLAAISNGYLDEQPVEAFLKLGGEEGFDMVLLQAHSTAMLTVAKRTRYLRAARQAAEEIRAAGAEVSLYMTPAYTDQHWLYRPGLQGELERGYTAAGNRLGALVVPLGTAFARAKAVRPDLVLHKADNSHPTLLGTYLGAATIFASYYDVSVVGNPWTYQGAVDEGDARFLQEIAEETVAWYFGG